MTVKEIIKKYLSDNGYGGLHNDDCGCFEDDLFPCDGPCDSCEPAYKVPAHCETCETGCDARYEDTVWCLTTVKPSTEMGSKEEPEQPGDDSASPEKQED